MVSVVMIIKIWDYWVKVSEINKKRKYDNEIYIDNLHELRIRNQVIN